MTDVRAAFLRETARSKELRERSLANIEESKRCLEELRIGQLGTSRTAALREEVAGLKRALVSRATIEQAKGIVIATTGRGPDDAFNMLVRQSQFENRKLRDIAAELVSRNIRSAPVNGREAPR